MMLQYKLEVEWYLFQQCFCEWSVSGLTQQLCIYSTGYTNKEMEKYRKELGRGRIFKDKMFL